MGQRTGDLGTGGGGKIVANGQETNQKYHSEGFDCRSTSQAGCHSARHRQDDVRALTLMEELLENDFVSSGQNYQAKTTREIGWCHAKTLAEAGRIDEMPEPRELDSRI